MHCLAAANASRPTIPPNRYQLTRKWAPWVRKAFAQDLAGYRQWTTLGFRQSRSISFAVSLLGDFSDALAPLAAFPDRVALLLLRTRFSHRDGGFIGALAGKLG
jgi:hypothetical protein